MANTIKLKQGSGSDPSASDLALGEPAIRTDTGEIFLKKDDGSIAKVAGGIDDGDKGDIVVSNSGATFTVDAGVITNAKVSGSAAIAGSKISPSFTSDITVTNASPKIQLVDSNSNPDWQFHNDNGTLRIDDTTANSTRLRIDSSGNVLIPQNLDVGAGVDVTGNILVSGTVDGRDIATDGSKLDGIASGATADQTASEILTLIKTVDGSGSGLDADLLDGISSASFVRSDASDTLTGATYTLSSTTNEKIILSGSSNPFIRLQEGTTDKAYWQFNSDGNVYFWNQEHNKGIRLGSQLNFYDGAYRTIWHSNNDGSGSGLDSDLLDGVQGSSYLRSDATDSASGDITFSGGAGAVTIAGNSDIRLTNGTWSGNTTSPKIQAHNSTLYIVGGTSGIIFRENTANRWAIDGSGNFDPGTDSTYDIGSNSLRVKVGYFDEVDSAEVRVNNGILETKAAIATSHTLATDFNAMSVSPTVNSGVTVTVPSGAVWAIV